MSSNSIIKAPVMGTLQFYKVDLLTCEFVDPSVANFWHDSLITRYNEDELGNVLA